MAKVWLAETYGDEGSKVYAFSSKRLAEQYIIGYYKQYIKTELKFLGDLPEFGTTMAAHDFASKVYDELAEYQNYPEPYYYAIYQAHINNAKTWIVPVDNLIKAGYIKQWGKAK